MLQPAVSLRALSPRDRVIAETVSLLYIVAVTVAASISGISYLLFPELGALAHDVLTRPWGKWASQPIRLLITPLLTATVGTLATRHLPYGILTILTVVCISIVLIRLLRSAIAPAISAGVFPLVLGQQSWRYPLSIACTVTILMGISIIWRAYCNRKIMDGPAAATPDVDDIMETPSRDHRYLLPFFLFLVITGSIAQLTGLRFLLFPPLIVMAYEMLGHPDTCPWATRPLSFPLACFLTAIGGLLATQYLRTVAGGIPAAALIFAWGVIVLRLFDIHMPPALAVGLIPLVMNKPDWLYPVSVACGTLALTATFLIYRKWFNLATAPRGAVGRKQE